MALVYQCDPVSKTSVVRYHPGRCRIWPMRRCVASGGRLGGTRLAAALAHVPAGRSERRVQHGDGRGRTEALRVELSRVLRCDFQKITHNYIAHLSPFQ